MPRHLLDGLNGQALQVACASSPHAHVQQRHASGPWHHTSAGVAGPVTYAPLVAEATTRMERLALTAARCCSAAMAGRQAAAPLLICWHTARRSAAAAPTVFLSIILQRLSRDKYRDLGSTQSQVRHKRTKVCPTLYGAHFGHEGHQEGWMALGKLGLKDAERLQAPGAAGPAVRPSSLHAQVRIGPGQAEATTCMLMARDSAMMYPRCCHAVCHGGGAAPCMELIAATRAALLAPCRTMATQLVEKERIRTTLPKANALRRVVDRVIGMGKEVRGTAAGHSESTGATGQK